MDCMLNQENHLEVQNYEVIVPGHCSCTMSGHKSTNIDLECKMLHIFVLNTSFKHEYIHVHPVHYRPSTHGDHFFLACHSLFSDLFSSFNSLQRKNKVTTQAHNVLSSFALTSGLLFMITKCPGVLD